jgi:hypothetical protein
MSRSTRNGGDSATRADTTKTPHTHHAVSSISPVVRDDAALAMDAPAAREDPDVTMLLLSDSPVPRSAQTEAQDHERQQCHQAQHSGKNCARTASHAPFAGLFQSSSGSMMNTFMTLRSSSEFSCSADSTWICVERERDRY